MTPFALLVQRCGLSLPEAAAMFGVSRDAAKFWSSGRYRTPPHVIDELRALYARIEHVAAETVVLVGSQDEAPAELEIGIASDDEEARSLGWPCVGAQAAAIGIAIARLDVPVRIVPRGSTSATAGAADIHGA